MGERVPPEQTGPGRVPAGAVRGIQSGRGRAEAGEGMGVPAAGFREAEL